MNQRFPKPEATLESIASAIGGLDVRMDKLEGSIDDLAITVKHEFDKVYVRLGDMDKHLVKLDQDFANLNMKIDGVQNQVDNIFVNFTMHIEHEKLGVRVKKLERRIFA